MAAHDSTPFVRVPVGSGFTLIDESDLPLVEGRSLQLNWMGYVQIRVERRYAMLHRVIMEPPAHLVVDHINAVRHDNRRSNLRVCTQAENLRNGRSHRDSTSKYRGVSLRRAEGSWRAQISIGNQRSRYLGQYATEEEAARAYDAAALAAYGEYARLNFPDVQHNPSHYLTREERRSLGLPMKNGGPGGIRTRDQAIMSGLTTTEQE